VDKQLLRILQELQDDNAEVPTLCSPFSDENLAAYIDAELSGHAGFEVDSAFQSHLATCAGCRQAYIELKQLFELEQADALIAPPVSPHFDFSYLAQRAAAKAPKAEDQPSGYLDELGRFVIRISALLLAATKPPLMAFGVRQAENGMLYQLSLPQATNDLQITIAIHEERNANQLCSVQVDVEIPSRGGWPHLAQIPVSLAEGAMHSGSGAVLTQRTDAFGKTVFRGVALAALPHLVLAIETGSVSQES